MGIRQVDLTLWHADDASLDATTGPPVNANPGGGWGFSSAGKVSGGGAAVPLRKDQVEGYDPAAAAEAAALAAELAPPTPPRFVALVLTGCELLSVPALRRALAARGGGLLHLDLSNGVRGVTELLKPASMRPAVAAAFNHSSDHYSHQHSSGQHHHSGHHSTDTNFHQHSSIRHHSDRHSDLISQHHSSGHHNYDHRAHPHMSSDHHHHPSHNGSGQHSAHHGSHHGSGHNSSSSHGSSRHHNGSDSVMQVVGYWGASATPTQHADAAAAQAAAQAIAELEKARREESRVTAALASLRFLSLSKCPALTATTIGLVALRCPRLLMLDLSSNGDSAVDDAGLRCLAAGARQLETLKLDRSKAITDDGLRPLVARCQRLAALHASRCPLLTGSFFLAEPAPGGPSRVVVKCGRLHLVDLSFCEGLDPFVLSWAGSSASKLRSVDVRGTPAVACAPALFALCACTKVRHRHGSFLSPAFPVGRKARQNYFLRCLCWFFALVASGCIFVVAMAAVVWSLGWCTAAGAALDGLRSGPVGQAARRRAARLPRPASPVRAAP
jgi:hypothetical protein